MKNEEDQILRKHFTDLARKADQSHIATFTGFLSLPEQSVFYSMDFSYVPYCVFGGQEGCERAVIRFGEEWELIRIDTENINTNVTRLLPAINAVLRRRKRNKEGNGHDGNRISGTD